MPHLTWGDAEFFAKMQQNVTELQGELAVGNLPDAAASVNEISGMLGEVQEFLDYAEEANR